MSRINQIAYKDDQEEDSMLSNEYSILFPLRNGPLPPITEQTNMLLYEALKCKICQQLMQTPVYLKCSHRFCRPCIQRYIRSSNKKGCPTCLAPVLSKRELRSCDFTMDFIDMAFGKVKINQNTDAEGDADSEKQEQEQFKVRRTYRRRQQSIETKTMGRKTRKRILRNTEDFQIDDPNLRGSTYISSLSREISQNDKSKQLLNTLGQSEVKVEDLHEIKMEEAAIRKKEQGQQPHLEKYPTKQVENSIAIPPSMSRSEPIQYATCQGIFIKITLEPLPSNPLTPWLNLQEIECSIFSNAELILNLISQEINLDSQLLTLYVMREDQLCILDPKAVLFTVNRQCWSSAGQLNQFDLSTTLNHLKNERQQLYAPKAINKACLIYYSVEFEPQYQKKQQVSPTKLSSN